MRTELPIRHAMWSVLVELRFSHEVWINGVKAKVHHVEADEVRWERDRQRGLRVKLLRHGDVQAPFSDGLLTDVLLHAVPPPGSRTNARWLPDEDRKLRQQHGRASEATIARLLGRSEGAVHGRLAALGLLPTSPGHIPHPRTAPESTT